MAASIFPNLTSPSKNGSHPGYEDAVAVEVSVKQMIRVALGTSATFHKGVPCYNVKNCRDNDMCVLGAAGPTCERCIDLSETAAHNVTSAYYFFGKTCLECPVIAYSCFFILIPFFLFVLGITFSGLTISICTKMKLLFQYLQLLVMTAAIQVPWPPLVLRVLSGLTFASLSSRMFLFECYIQDFNYHYAAWATTLTTPILVALVLRSFIRMDLDKPADGSFTNLRTALIKKMLRRRTTLISRAEALTAQGIRDLKIRRFLVMILMMYYAPNCVSVLQTFACTGSFPFVNMTLNTSDVFFLDNRISCIDFGFQVFNALYLILGFTLLVMPVVWIFIVRRHYKWNELNLRIRTFGALYESYSDTACHWEGAFMVRVLVLAMSTELFPFASDHVSAINFSLTCIYMIFLLIHRPFRKCSWTCLPALNLHNMFEMIATLSLLSLQFMSLILSRDIHLEYLDYIVVGSIIFSVVVWLIIAVRIKSENEMAEENIPEYYQGGQVQRCCCLPCKKQRVAPEASSSFEVTRQASVGPPKVRSPGNPRTLRFQQNANAGGSDHQRILGPSRNENASPERTSRVTFRVEQPSVTSVNQECEEATAE